MRPTTGLIILRPWLTTRTPSPVSRAMAQHIGAAEADRAAQRYKSFVAHAFAWPIRRSECTWSARH